MLYKLVVNDEEQYSISPTYRENALGWRLVADSLSGSARITCSRDALLR
jgi:uncharacterized protein YbdZ (MbtH family)